MELMNSKAPNRVGPSVSQGRCDSTGLNVRRAAVDLPPHS